jgi:hypothetical protein
MNQKRKRLIGSIYGEKIMVISPLLKWYVQHGLKMTKIHQVVEYTPASWSGTFRSIFKAPSIRSSITARKMVSSVILNCPAQGLCMSFTKAFTALILFLQTAEMPPVFENIHVSRDDIGDHMKAYAEERGIMNQKRKCLIGSIYGEKIMVISPLLKCCSWQYRTSVWRSLLVTVLPYDELLSSFFVSATIFLLGSISPAHLASLMLSPNFWKQDAGVYSTT